MLLVSSTYHIWSMLDLVVVSIGATCVGMCHVWFLTFQSSFILWIIFVISDPSSLLAYVNLYFFGVVLYTYIYIYIHTYIHTQFPRVVILSFSSDAVCTTVFFSFFCLLHIIFGPR
jgi:hypothetical protein